MLAVIDYGSGNLESVVRALRQLGAEPVVAQSPAAVEQADRLVLPGVGFFDKAMAHLESNGLANALRQRVEVDQVPILGICLGFQLFTRRSEEGGVNGFGWIDAETRRFDFGGGPEALKVPHMGWNEVAPPQGAGILAGLEPGACFYFAHSYYVACNDPEAAAATTVYGHPFTSAVQRGNIIGTQFHPEISHVNGFRLLERFLESA
ncbi:MAG: imidazole glycerol phosphate synthase subunit HisH [Candidatus Hydrogenedens sp.]|nr:imidazole glycerol phosphate synthase subunit HisH [Candidatus Hydrogenedens sp.]